MELSSAPRHFPEGAGGLSDAAHRRVCVSKKCTRCIWLQLGKRWRTQVGDWLDARLDLVHHRFGIGCTWCSLVAADKDFKKLGLLRSCHNNAFANFAIVHTKKVPIIKHRLVRHQKCPAHVACAAIASGQAVPVTAAVPAAEEWYKVIAQTQSGAATSVHGILGQCSGKKLRNMQWCLAEAKRGQNREALRRAICITISQDKRGTRFLLRFRSADAALDVQDGVLDLSCEVGDLEYSGADGLRRATLLGLERACTPSKPPMVKMPAPVLDRSLLESVALKAAALSLLT